MSIFQFEIMIQNSKTLFYTYFRQLFCLICAVSYIILYEKISALNAETQLFEKWNAETNETQKRAFVGFVLRLRFHL